MEKSLKSALMTTSVHVVVNMFKLLDGCNIYDYFFVILIKMNVVKVIFNSITYCFFYKAVASSC